MKLIILLATVAVAAASCPNDCNGHGTCNVYSACDCYRNWMGADCSERVCYFGLAFVDTPVGDINADGLISDTKSSANDGFKSRTVNQDVNEIYPWYAGWGGTHYKVTLDSTAASPADSATVVTTGGARGEAHFYKECSNKGICNRQSGTCECFPGFTGEGCSRTACANDCSGHGTCTRMVDKTNGNYFGWDAYATQSCSCDSGYFGADCSLRKCPMGDDPVTKYTGFTRITLQDKATYGGASGTGYYDAEQCPHGNMNLADLSAVANNGGDSASVGVNLQDTQSGTAGATVDWVTRIWSHDLQTTSSPAYCGGTAAFAAASNCYGWNAWYSVAGTSAALQVAAAHTPITNIAESTPWAENDLCAWSSYTAGNTALCMQQPISYRTLDRVGADQSAVSRANSAIYTTPMTVTGTASQATGTLTGGGCAGALDQADIFSCPSLDFWSLYLKNVTGQFQVGDTIQVEGTSSGVRTFGYTLCNYVKEVGTYYASSTNQVQADEEQVISIAWNAMTAAATAGDNWGASTKIPSFSGEFALEFTDEMGDTWVTAGISVSATNIAAGLTGADFAATADASETTGGAADLVAQRIQDALEALPNKVVPNVQVEYRVPSTGAAASLLERRYFSISFLDNSGNIPQLKVSYSFTDAADYSGATGAGNGAVKVATNATCSGSSDTSASKLACMPFFANASAAQITASGTLTGLSTSTAGVTVFDHSTAQLATLSKSVGLDGTKENVECSNRGICDYSSGLCQCFTGFTEEDCSVQNSLAQG